MFDAAAAATAAEVRSEQVAQDQAEAAVSSEPSADGATTDQTDSHELLQAIASYVPGEHTTEVVFVDPTVPEYQSLIAGTAPNVEVVMLDATRDGMEQIAESLAGRTGIDAIHLISHGSAGELHLGTGILNAESMSGRYATEMATIQHALSEQADLLVYGCDFAKGEAGQLAVDRLAELTGADVEASNDLTGHISLGADWDFEIKTGSIETQIAITEEAQMNWVGVLGTETVKDTFSSASYSNNNGTQSWSTSWSETDAGGSGASGGDIRVASSQLRIDAVSVGDKISRGVDLSGASSATLTFDFTNNLSSTGKVEIRVSTDAGTTYQTLTSGVFSSTSHTGSGSVSFDLSGYMSSGTKIQFIVTGASGGDRLFVDNVQISYTANSAPTISNLGGDSLSYTEGAGAVVIDQGANALVADSDSANFDTGTLTVSIPSGNEPTEDVLSIRNQGTGAGQIGVSGSAVTYGGVTIGTFTGGAGGNNLVVTLNSNATPTAVTALVKNITYEDINVDAPAPGGLTIRFSLTDGDGGTSANYDVSAFVTAVNDAPTDLALSASTVAENAANGTVVGTVTATDPDTGDTQTYSLTDTAGGRFAINSSTGVITVANGSLLNYESATSHTITVRVTDSGGLTYSETFTIQLTDVNEGAPVITSNGGGTTASVSVTENTTAVTTVTATDVDTRQTLTYSISGGADAAKFTINSSTGALSFITAPNYESPTDSGGNNVYDVTVQVSDGRGGTDTQAIAVTVAPINEAPTDLSLSANTVAENAANGTVVGTITGTDPDTGDTKSYSFTDSAGGRFAINSSTGQITVANSSLLNYESATSHSVTVRVTDSGGLTYDETFTINLTNVNETPTDLSLSANTVAENAANGTVVGMITGTDPDTGDTKSYSFTDSAGGRFAINSSTGQITVANSSLLNYESATSHSVTVRVTDSGGLTYDETFTINLTNVNEAPAGADTGVTISEDTSHTLTAANFGFSDVDAGDTLSAVRIDTLPTAGTLKLSGVNVTAGQVITAADINAGNVVFSPSGDGNGLSYATLTFSVRDSGNLYDAAPNTLTFHVTAVNDAPVNVLPGAKTVAVDTPLAVTGVVVNDVDGNLTTVQLSVAHGTVAVALSGGVAISSGASGTATLTISGTQADINATLSSLTYQGDSLYTGPDTLTVLSTDSNGATDTDTVSITVSNDAPTNILPAPQTVAEDTPLAISGLSVSDADGNLATVQLSSNNGTLTVSLSGATVISAGSNGSNSLTLSGTQAELNATLASLIYQGNPNFTGLDTMTMTSVDQIGTADTDSLSITVTAVDDAPTDLALSSTSVVEHAANGTTVGTVTPADPDAGDTFTYQLTNDAGGRFTIDSATGQITVVDGTLLDIEFASSHNVTVRVTDSGGLTYDKTFTINLIDVNEAPRDLSLSGNTVAENAATGTVIGTVTGLEVDVGDSLTYSLTDTVGGRFAIDSSTGVLTVADGSLLNYESASSHDVTVRVTDSGGLTYDETFTINLTDVNEMPTDLSLSANTVAEHAANGTTVGTVTPADPDAGDTFTYQLTNDAGGRFAIDSTTGQITVADGSLLHYDAIPSHDVTVRVTDSGGLTYDKTYTIDLTDINETPEDLILSSNTVVEHAANGTVIGTATGIDPDTGNSLTYSLTDSAGGRFAINSITGQITVADGSLLDYESATSHDVTIRVTDGGGLTYDETFTINLTDLNEAPTDLSLSANTVVENATNGTVVGTASTIDPDTADTHTYQLIDDAGGRFAINSITGQITVVDGSLLNYESAASHDVTIRVTDSGGLTYDKTFTINLTDLNETPTDLALSANTVAENAANGTVVGTISVTDPDTGDTKTYSLTDTAGGRFAIDASTGQITVADGSLLDFESATTHSVTVRVTDSGGITYDETFTINVTNVNETPTAVGLSGTTVVERAVNGTVVGTATTSDPDAGDTHTYQLLNNAGGRFTIDSTTGVITVADGSLLDAQVATSHTITIRTTDAGGLTHDQIVTISVTTGTPLPTTTVPGPLLPGMPSPPTATTPPTTSGPVTPGPTDGGTPTTGPVPTPAVLPPDAARVVSSPVAPRVTPVSVSPVGPGHVQEGDKPVVPDEERGLVAWTVVEPVLNLLHEAADQLRTLAQSPELPAKLSEFIVKELDAMTESLEQAMEGEQDEATLVAATAAGVSIILSTGYVVWALRGGWLLASLLATMPAWRSFDPLPVLVRAKEDRARASRRPPRREDERIEHLFGPEEGKAA